MESIQEIKERFKNTPIQELPAFVKFTGRMNEKVYRSL